MEGPNHVVRFASPVAMHMVGPREILGKPIGTAMPELVDQGYIGLLDTVFSTAETIRVPFHTPPARNSCQILARSRASR